MKVRISLIEFQTFREQGRNFLIFLLILISWGWLIVFTLQSERTRDHTLLFKVEILNGSGVDGAARQLMYRIINGGGDVLGVETYRMNTIEHTLILSRKANCQSASIVRGLLHSGRMIHIEDAGIYDVTIVLGKDLAEP